MKAVKCNCWVHVVTLACVALVSATTFAQRAPLGRLVSSLPDDAWESSMWISARDAAVADWDAEKNPRAADGTSWFVCTLENPAGITRAEWMTAGLGVYQLYVNGKPIGQEVLRPGFTHYERTKLSFTYDVTQAMRRGKGRSNTFSVQSSPGWWADKIITAKGRGSLSGKGMTGRKVAFRGVLRLTFANGSTRLYGTDTLSWHAGVAGPVTHAAIFDGEEYDARRPAGWLTPELLSRPERNDEFHGQIVPTNGAEVYRRTDLALCPVEAYVWQGVRDSDSLAYGRVVITRRYAAGKTIDLHAGETLVVDFGQNAAAVPAFTFRAAEGTVLTCLPAELLNDSMGLHSRGMDGPEGSVHRRNLRTPDVAFRMAYTFPAGGRYVSYMPQCTFFGYRYVSVTATANVQIKSIRSIPVTSITHAMETGTMTTGNPDINRLLSNILWGMRSNYLSVPTDCPQRNERLGWAADTQVFASTGTFFAATDRFLHKWMRDMRDTQSPEGGYPGVAPFGQYCSDEFMRLGWSDAGIIVPWTVWKQFGDNSIIDENWSSMTRYMDHVNSTKYDHNALKAENKDYQWADWLSYEPLESWSLAYRDENGPKPEALEYWNYLSACYWAIDAQMMADMARATGRDAARFEQMVANAKDYISSKFITADGHFRLSLLNSMQTPALFALHLNLVDGMARQEMITRLRKNFIDHQMCLQTGFLGTSILMPTLTANGMTDVAYNLLFQHRNPSWLYSVDNGATTIWERWNSYMRSKGMGPAGMNSFNHYAYGCVGQWLWETAAGIAADPQNPGFKHIIMRPEPDRRLGHLEAEYHSAAGLIKSAWRYDGDTWRWTFTIPRGATATVTLPGETTGREYQAGTHTISKRL